MFNPLISLAMIEKIYARICEMRSAPLEEMASTLAAEFHITHSAAEQMILASAMLDALTKAIAG